MANGDNKAWNLSTIIITGMAGLIAVLLLFGFNSLGNKIDAGDTAINLRLAKIEDNQRALNGLVMRMQSDITRIDTLQKMRIDRENREENRRNGSSR